MDLRELLDIKSVAVGVEGDDKKALIDAVIDLIAGSEAVEDVDEVRNAVHRRESTMSTGVGKGLALPHAKTSAVTGIVAALVTTKEPVEFGALDNAPVQIVFLLVGKQDAKSQHVRILSRFSRMMNRDENRDLLLSATTAEGLLESIYQAEATLN